MTAPAASSIAPRESIITPVAIAPVDPLSFTEDMPEFPPAVLEALATPVDPAWCELRKVKEDSDRELLYVPWIHYQQVLTKAFGVGGFKLVPRAVPRTEGNEITWVGALFVRIPGTSKFHFIKEAKGGCNSRIGPSNAAEGAESDCLTKCCKRLNIFMELYDPAWRAAWERNYKGTHRQDRAKAAWPTYDRAPAAPSAPAAPAPAKTSAPAADARGNASPKANAGETAAGTAASPGATGTTTNSPTPTTNTGTIPMDDTGEAASDLQKDAIKGAVRALKPAWKGKMVKDWFAVHFGIARSTAPEVLEALTAQQADTAVLLLSAFGTGSYDALLAKMKAEGGVR